jgi:biopolymer transport protein ExbB
MISRLLFNRFTFTAASLFAVAAPVLAQDDAPAEGPPSQSVGDIIAGGGIIGGVIILLSVVALALVIENLVSLKRDKLAPPDLVDELEALFDERSFQEAMDLCEGESTLLTSVVSAGIGKIGHSFEVIEKSLEEMGDEEAIKLHQKIGWISIIANVAPMMGLLGTVSGMVAAFRVIATSKNPDPSELADGISMALLTTLFGLVVAIPTTAAFAYLRNNLVRSVIEVGAIVEDLFERFRPEEA